MSDTYADHPVSIGEMRASKASDASLWSPREMLISILRDIDSGKINPDQMVVCFSSKGENGRPKTGWRQCGADPMHNIGLVAQVQGELGAHFE